MLRRVVVNTAVKRQIHNSVTSISSFQQLQANLNLTQTQFLTTANFDHANIINQQQHASNEICRHFSSSTSSTSSNAIIGKQCNWTKSLSFSPPLPSTANARNNSILLYSIGSIRYSSSSTTTGVENNNDDSETATMMIDPTVQTEVIEKCTALHSSIMPLNEKLRGPLAKNSDKGTSLPFVFLVGNHSSGKSSFINYVLGRKVQTAGVAPTDDCFTVIAPGPVDTDQDGPALVGDPDMGFSQLSRHPQLRTY